MRASLDQLPDTSPIRIVTACPALGDAAREALVADLADLFARFVAEDKIERFAVEADADGALFPIAWSERGEPLSGCRKDRVNRLLANHETASGAALVVPPIAAVADSDGVRALDLAGLKAAVLAGEVGGDTPMWNLVPEDLGSWRSRPRLPLRDHPLAIHYRRWAA